MVHDTPARLSHAGVVTSISSLIFHCTLIPHLTLSPKHITPWARCTCLSSVNEREPRPPPPLWALGASIVHRALGQPVAVSWQDVMLMGDFNADCSYVTSSQWSSIRLRTLAASWSR